MTDIVNETYSVSEKIITFISENYDALKSEPTTQIAELAAHIQTAVTPLLIWTAFHERLERCLTELESLLGATHTNLVKWKDARSHRVHISFSRSAPRELKSNVEYLIRRHKALMDIVQIVERVKGYNYVIPAPSMRSFIEDKSKRKMKMGSDDVDAPSPFEARDLWKCYIGDETEFAESEEFCGHLSDWMDEELDPTARKRLLLRLDQNHTGYIAFKTFQSFIRNGKLRETVHLYIADPQLPLLIWVDGDVSHVMPQMLEAITRGVKILQFSSTSTIKSWITMHKEFLMKHDSPAQIRVISNQTLYERDDSHMSAVNHSAGFDITSHIRDAKINIPILIYTTKNDISSTKYVTGYANVGSVAGNHLVYLAYIFALANGKVDDVLWKKYNAHGPG